MSLSETRLRQFGAGLLYDVLRWTPRERHDMKAVLAALRILRQDTFDEAAYRVFYTTIHDAGFNMHPEIHEETGKVR